MTDEEIKNWLWDESNELNCSECPYAEDGKHRSCGQQQCWVTTHIEHNRRD